MGFLDGMTSRRQDVTTKGFLLKAAGAAAVGFVFFAEVAEEAVLLGEDLDEHDDEENYPDKQGLPRPEPDDESGEVGEGAGEHRIAVEAIGTIGHEMLCAGTDLFAESIHRVAFAAVLHIDDRPHAEAEASEDEDAGKRGAECADMYRQIRRTRHQPHDGRKKDNKHHGTKDVAGYFSKSFHGSICWVLCFVLMLLDESDTAFAQAVEGQQEEDEQPSADSSAGGAHSHENTVIQTVCDNRHKPRHKQVVFPA